MKITGKRLAIAFVLCLLLSSGRAGAETWRQEATDDFVKGEWEGIIVRTPSGIQLDIQPGDAVEVFDAPEAYVMGVCFFKGKLYAATSMGDEGPRNEKTAMLLPTGGIYEQSGKRWKKVVDLNSFITGSGRHRAVLGMAEFNGKIYTATQGAHSFDGTEWKAAPNAAGRGAFMNVAQGKLYYGMPNQARSIDAEGKGQTAAKQPIDSWGIDNVHPFRGLVYMATGYACKLYNTRNINQPVALWQHNTDDNIGGMAVYGGRLFLGTEGRKGEVWAMRTIDPGPAKGGGPGLTFDGCKWVWFPDKNLPSAPPGTYYFRRIVELDPKRKVRDATFMLAADDRLELFLNGSEVARSPEGGWAKVVLADVTKLMKAGKNVFGIAATNGGGAGGLIGRLIIEYASG
ncbi:MAG: hypothetical protein QF662_08390, partial [Phycisphaerae bacterium]|nr:hypothetical protein [Phycisphaerae bacterium]